MAGSSKKRNANSNTGNTRKKNSSARSKKNNAYSSDMLLSPEIVFIISIAVGLFLFLCNLHLIGSVGDYISLFLFGVFGFLAYIFPIVFVVIVWFYLKAASDKKRGGVLRVKLWALALVFVFAGVLVELLGGVIRDLNSYSLVDIWENSSIARSGGGILSGSLCYLMFHYLDTAGTVLVDLVVIFIGLIIITGNSLIDIVKNGGLVAWNAAKDDAMVYREEMARAKEESKKRQREILDEMEEEKAIPRYAKVRRGIDSDMLNNKPDIEPEEYQEITQTPRRDKKVSGVMLDTNLKKNKSKKRNDIHEIMIDTSTDETELETVKAFSSNPYDKMHEITYHGMQSMPEAELDNGNGLFDDRDDVEVKRQDKVVEISEGSFTFNQATVGKQTDVYDSSENSQTDLVRKTVKKTVSKKYKAPTVDLLNKINGTNSGQSQSELAQKALLLEESLNTFGVEAKVTDISQGPSVTRFELKPKAGVRVSKIVSLTDDIKLSLAASDIRIEAPIPGKQAVGIEVPNDKSTGVALRELLEAKEFKNFDSKIAFAVGKDITGKVVVADIAKMPHMLIAGATGSGKSVCINTIIMSILYKAHPDEVKLIMIDPKVVELSVYNGIPHLMVPVVTDPKKAAAALNWGVSEMTDRYQKFADKNVRDLKGYNKIVADMHARGDGEDLKILPQIVIIVDELADLMMVAAKEVEESICRLAQLARACGIHLIIATQRPSVDVITGLIKANMPSRVAFAVSSGTDSRTILDMNGAEKLLGKGDMLFYPQGYPKPARVQGAFVSDGEVGKVVDFLKAQNIIVDNSEEDILSKMSSISAGNGSGTDSSDSYDDLFVLAGKFIIEQEKASIGSLQRKFKIGFNRAARIMDQLSEAGVVGPEVGTKPREILMGPEQFEQFVEEYI